ncbi:hypothetical protein [Marinomonas algicola]|uniref:hypothetical protein n=1 Tax=Marinomonas algicola TaxID=2773454 RepID=UPI0017490B33|nr:hypothetical protein [Marinomonas algicola]
MHTENKIGSTDLSSSQIELIINDLAHLRQIADLELLPKHPHFEGKLYPLGRCKEIRDKVFSLLKECLPQTQLPGLLLIKEQLTKGIPLQKQWGSLRDEYFQNAMILGDLYIDVSNDTVNPNKPRVEILPLKDANFGPLSSFEQFIKVAASYWEVEFYQNTIFPALAPFLPLVYIDKKGRSKLGYAGLDLLQLAMQSKFTASKSVMSTLPEPAESIKDEWRKSLKSIPHNDFLHNHEHIQDYFQEYQDKHLYLDSHFCNQALNAYHSLPKVVKI